MKTVPNLVDVVKKATAESVGPTRKGQVGTTRVDIKHLEQKTFQVTSNNREQEFQFLMDEPAVRGGQNHGATPLGYFLAGAGG